VRTITDAWTGMSGAGFSSGLRGSWCSAFPGGMHAGFDRLQYPGDDVMTALWQQTNLSWCGLYLAPAPSQPYTGWMTKVATLRAQGWGLAPVFVGQQAPGGPGSHTLTAAQGTTDAASAVALADQAVIGDGAVIYLDVEIGGGLAADIAEYAHAWFAGVRASKYRAGTYCSYLKSADQLLAADPDIFLWVFNINKYKAAQTLDANGAIRRPDIVDSGVGYATAWQFLQGVPSISYNDAAGTAKTLANIDLDTATVLDPSFP
jgi:hypothetical protein